jgi:hypothetical protein
MMQELYENAREPEEIGYGKWHMPLLCPADILEACARLDPRGPQVGVPRDLLSDRVEELLAKVSIARCARVSLLTHEGVRDLDEDVGLHDKLLVSGHMSPFEHVARPATPRDDSLRYYVTKERDFAGADQPDRWQHPREQRHGNFIGWLQYRKTIPYEADILAPRMEDA